MEDIKHNLLNLEIQGPQIEIITQDVVSERKILKTLK